LSGISVIIPAFNAEATLAETIESILTQTVAADEMIVVDDGSTDRTGVLAGGFPGLKVIRQKNRGAASALNAGIAASTGELLTFLDADDLWEADKLEKQSVQLRSRPDLDAVGGYMRTFVCPSAHPDQAARYRLPEAPEPCWLTGALMVRRHCFERCGHFSEDLAVAYNIDWFDRLRNSGASLAMLETVVLRRRIRPGSLSHRSVSRDASMVEMARRAIARRRGIDERS
jgi:glycosyltransferase involved in cell wall biosynthesis